MKFILSIETDNEGMLTAEDVADALERVASKIRDGHESRKILDVNGNTVGSWKLEIEKC